jgi:UPF0755 protein
LVAVLVGLGWLVVVYPAEPGAHRGKTANLVIEASSSVEDVASMLHAQGLVAQPRVFAWYARVLGAAPRLRRGHVLVTDAMSVRELLQRIARGFGSTELSITVPEGFNRFDIADRLALWGVCERDAFLQATQDHALLAQLDASAPSAEGYLFPDTYRVRDESDASVVARKMLDNGHARLSRLLDGEAAAFARLHDELGLDLHGLVTLASIVEKEAHAASEQAIIAGVFWNRLRDPAFKPKRLQADPTVAYGCLALPVLASCQGFDGRRVTRTMTADPENPYNTYRLDGLPRGPVSNPGLGALRAVLHPAAHDYFYFVARGDGRHDFSATLAEHNQAVQSHR